MKKTIVFTAVLLMISSTVCLGEVLFLHHFDDTSSADARTRLTADYAAGDPKVKYFEEHFGTPDTNSAQAKFGGASVLRSHDVYKKQHVASYELLDNLNMMKGSVEGWIYLNAVHIVYTRLGVLIDAINLGDPNNSGKVQSFQIRYEDTGKITFSALKSTPDEAGSGKALSTDTADLNTWQYISADWKLDSNTPSENFIRLWVDGVFQDEVSDLPKFDDPVNESALLGVFGYSKIEDVDIIGWGDEFRVTDGLISDLYTLDGNLDYTPPTQPFPTPALVSCVEALKYGKLKKLTDLNSDCYSNFKDFVLLGDDWLGCNDPNTANCP